MKFPKRFNLFKATSKLIYRIRTLSFVKHILIFYLIITFVGAGLLFAPIAHRSGVSVKYEDALFTAASAFSDTGLVSVATAPTYSIFGQAIIAILIFIGGLGWFALKVYFFNIIFGRPITFSTRDALSAERGSAQVGFSKEIIKITVTILLIIIVIAAVVLSIIFFYTTPDSNPYNLDSSTPSNMLTAINGVDGKSMVLENPHGDYLVSLRFGIFHAVSALNNAGFDIIGSNSIAPYYHQYGIQVIFIVLFMIGGMGYPVIYDLYLFSKAKVQRKKFYWSLFTKLSVSVYFLVSIIGLASTFGVEVSAHNHNAYDSTSGTHQVYTFWNNPMYGSTTDKSMALFFNSFSTRNAGFATVRLGDLSPTTILIFSILMFIGSAPSSTAGGIRTTTLGIAVAGLWSRIRGRESVRLFNRRIPSSTVIRSYIVITVGIVIVLVATIVAYSTFDWAGGQANATDSNMFLVREVGTNNFIPTPYNLNELVFEVSSAFGTTGLTAGLTPMLSLAGKLVLILVMFIGQLGVSSSLFIWKSRKSKGLNYSYVKEDVSIG